MRITDIQLQKNQKNRVNVWIDGSFAFGMFEKDAAALKLQVEQELSEAQLSEIKQNIVLRNAKETALQLLSRRDFTKQMMLEKLKQKQIPGDIAEQVITFLKEYHYLDDEAYAKRYVKYYSETRGKHRLRQELLQKGINSEIIDRALKEVSQEEALYRMVEKKIMTLPPDYGKKELQRLKNYFLRRGFSYDEINTCFSRLTDEREWSNN